MQREKIYTQVKPVFCGVFWFWAISRPTSRKPEDYRKEQVFLFKYYLTIFVNYLSRLVFGKLTFFDKRIIMADLEIDGIEIGWGTFFLVHEGYPVQAIYKDNGNTLIGYERLYFFQCDRKGCDNSQFGVLQGQLDDAGGMIRCDICDSVCCDVTGTRLECTCSETVELYPTE